MLKNYLLIAARSLRRQKGYAAINVLGLAVGLACSFFVLFWVSHEVGVDRFHEKGNRLYRVMAHAGDGAWSAMPKPVADALGSDYPEVEHALLMGWRNSPLLTVDGQSVHEDGHYAGPAFFEMFSFPLVEGDPATVIDDPSSVAISEAAASRLFGPDWQTRGVVGETITVDDRKDFRVSGVFADIPESSSVQADVVLPIADYVARNDWLDDWGSSALEVYVELAEGADAEAVDAKIAGLVRANREASSSTLFLQPFEDMYLYGDYENGQVAGGRIAYVRLFVAVAVFLLLIAAINFMNLATARAGQRANEIGVRKAIGAGQSSIALRFLLEAVLLAGGAFVVALGLVALLLPAFGDLTGFGLSLGQVDPRFLLVGGSLALVVGLLAGSYPALYLSSFRPAATLRGTFRQGRGAARLRRGLVVFQFALSTLLIVGTLVVYLQMDYIRTKDLGMDRENVVYTVLEGPAKEQFDAVRQDLLRRPGIESVTAAHQSPLFVGSSTGLEWEGRPEDDQTSFNVILTDYDFVETMRMTMAAGRTFSRDFASDSSNIVINETAAKAMGLADPVGQSVEAMGEAGTIIGVVEDFNMTSLDAPIQPAFLKLDPDAVWMLYARTAPGQTAEALASLEAVFDQFNAGYPFEYTFLDADYEAAYRAEAVMGTLTRIFAGVALFVAGLGLFGLVSFTAEQRRKEVGVRKVLGASVPRLVALLTKDFAALLAVAFVVAMPLAYVGMARWLDGFAYHADVGAAPFVIAGGLLVLIAGLTVSTQALRAATADPVRALRSE